MRGPKTIVSVSPVTAIKKQPSKLVKNLGQNYLGFGTFMAKLIYDYWICPRLYGRSKPRCTT